MTTAQVAFSKEFLESYSGLPKKIQKKVREFTEKFQRDPTQPGLNFERIEEARDPKVRCGLTRPIGPSSSIPRKGTSSFVLGWIITTKPMHGRGTASSRSIRDRVASRSSS